jgi:amidase
MRALLVCGLLAAARLCTCADLSGDWIAVVNANHADPVYARVQLTVKNGTVSGSWSQMTVQGKLTGIKLQIVLLRDTVPMGTLTGTLTAQGCSGEGQMNGSANEGSSTMESVTWSLTRPARPPAGGPRTIDFEPSTFHGYYSASLAPVLHIFPGDTLRSRTFDASGRDADRRGPGGNPETGPFFIEGALPGDTLVVKLKKLRLNRDSARQSTHINGRTVTPAYVANAKYDQEYTVDWTLDSEKGIARLTHPSEKMKNFSVPLLPMLGCISTAPASRASYRATELGPFGGNMDYNQMIEGVTLYLPVFHAGALLTFGDGHAAMGDGELTGTALETSLDVEITVDLIKNYATAFPRLENDAFVMSIGVAGSVPDAIQFATAQLADWIKQQFGLSDSEVGIVLGSVAKYDIAEMVDPQFSVVAKVPKAALAAFK